MELSRRLLLAAGATLAGRPANAEIFDVAKGYADTIPFSMRDVDAVLPAPISGPRPLVACFYYQSWYHDPTRMRALHLPPEFTEWDRVGRAKPVVPCEIQPKVPAWGEFDASDSHAVEQEIAAAAQAGINAFVYTWLFGGGRSMQMAPLDDGFLRASNRSLIQFALMWVNQNDIQVPLDYDALDWSAMADVMLQYMVQPNYWKVSGKPVLGIYKFAGLLRHYGADVVRKHIVELKARAERAGLPGLYVFCCADYKGSEDPGKVGFDACTAYNGLGLTPFGINPRNTVVSYRVLRRRPCQSGANTREPRVCRSFLTARSDGITAPESA
jgi:Glycosyltransferase WbsX